MIQVYIDDIEQAATLFVTQLEQHKIQVVCAESCTGGLLAGAITSVPNASRVFVEGLVTYSNISKINRLGVEKRSLDKYGAVSKITAQSMLRGLLRTHLLDKKAAFKYLGISITGIAGPGGATEDKPVGLVYIASGFDTVQHTEQYHFEGSRQEIRLQATLSALKQALISLTAVTRTS